MKKTMVIALVLLLGLTMPYFALNGEPLELDDAARADLPGKVAHLSDGDTYYELRGPEDGPVLVLVHGYSIPSFTWDGIYGFLSGSGYRVLRYDLYGRGWSERPRLKYDPDLFDRQLSELLDYLLIKQPVYLTGISMGGAICVEFTKRHSRQVKKLALLAPYGFPQKLPATAGLLKVPALGEYLMGVVGTKVLMSRLPSNFKNVDNYPEIEKKFVKQMRYRGYKRALLSTMRHMMPVDFTPSFEAVGRSGTPTLLIWGSEDAVVPFSNSEKVKKAIPDVDFHALDGVGHVIPLEQPAMVTRLLIEFFARGM